MQLARRSPRGRSSGRPVTSQVNTFNDRAEERPLRRLARGVGGAFDVLRDCVEIGPIGALARVGVGVLLVCTALFGWDLRWLDPVLGLLVMPGLVLGFAALHSRRSDTPVRAAGPLGHALNVAVFVPLFLWPVTAGGAALFYGGSMLVAAVRRSGGCEVTAISNALLGRDDQVGCAVFAPIDLAETHLRRLAA